MKAFTILLLMTANAGAQPIQLDSSGTQCSIDGRSTGLCKEQKPWTAMSVYSDGRLSINENISSERICRQALCMVKDHMTCEEVAERDRKAEEERKLREAAAEKRKEDFRITHPCVTKMEDWGKDADGKSIKKPVSRCPLPGGGEEAYGEDGKFLWAGGQVSMSVSSFTLPSAHITKQACFQ